MNQWKNLLKTLGFTDSEAKIYLLSLETGPSSVQDLAKKASVSRVTMYAAIDILTQRGLMSNVQKGKKTLYTAESPERLISFVQTRVKEMENTLHDVEALISELKLLQRGEKPVVKMFEGIEGLKAIHDDVLSVNPKLIQEMTNIDAMLALFKHEDFLPYRKELDRRKVKTEMIFTSSKPITAREHAEVIQLPGKATFFGNVTVYGNRVALTSLRGKNISVLVESEIIADTVREMFNLAKKGSLGK